jgi:hypothetical protein
MFMYDKTNKKTPKPKVKLFLCLIKHQTMKTYRGVEVQLNTS